VSAVPHIPYQSEGRSRRMKKSMVSKAADKSKGVIAVTFPVSMFSDVSL